MKVNAWLVVALALLAAGCVDRSAYFIPPCGTDAPTRLEVQTGTERIDATLNQFVANGWGNVTPILDRRVATADCTTGTKPAVLVDQQRIKDLDAVFDGLFDGFACMGIAVLLTGLAMGLIPGNKMLAGSIGMTLAACVIWTFDGPRAFFWPILLTGITGTLLRIASLATGGRDK